MNFYLKILFIFDNFLPFAIFQIEYKKKIAKSKMKFAESY